MAKGVPLTVAQAATIKRVWLETANASEAARAAGCHEASARRYIIRQSLPNAADLYADALAREERLHLAVVAKGRRKVSEALDSADADVAELTRAANDSLRAVNATRIAHLKATGAHSADKVEATVAASVVVLPALDDSAEATDSSVGAEPRSSD